MVKREKDVKKEIEKTRNKEAKIPEKPKKSYEKQTKNAVIIMLILIGLVFFVNWVIQSSNQFDYNGLKFYKEKEGNIQYYKSLLGYVTASGEQVPFILKLRNDPKDLEEISIEGGMIRIENKKIILSLSPEIVNCSDTYMTMIDFSRTLKAFSYDTSAGTTSRDYGWENDIPQATCKQAKDQTVIIMQEGETSKISVDKSPYESIIIKGGEQTIVTKYKDCYILEITNCETQKSFEKFILELISNTVVG